MQSLGQDHMTASTTSAAQLKRQTTTDALADDLRRRIVEHEFDDGTPLRQDELARRYGVSRIPVREALLRLEGEGLVRSRRHRGYTVASLSPAEIEELFDLRALIECDLLRRALPHLDDDALATARSVLTRFEESLKAGGHAGQWGDLNWELHAALYRHAGRPRSLDLAAQLHRQADRYLRLHLSLGRRTMDRARREHRELVDLCANGYGDEAVILLQRHIGAARDDLIRFMATRKPG